MNALLPANEAERLAALRAYGVLDTLPEQSFDDITLLASQICGTPMAVISLVDEARQWFKSRVGLGLSETPRDVAFCAHAILQPAELLEVPDARADLRFSENPLVTRDPRLRFYAGAPLVSPDGHALGTLCALDYVPRSLTEQQRTALRVLSRQVVTLLELHRQTIALAHEAGERQRAERQLEQQVAALSASRAETEELLAQSRRSRRALLSGIEDAKKTAERLHETEIHFRVLFESAPYCIHEIDRPGRLTLMNPAGLRMMGAKGPDEICGLPYLSAVGDADRVRIGRLLEEAFQGQVSEFEFQASNGARYQSSFAPIRDASGAIGRVMGLTQDITERSKREEAMRLTSAAFKAITQGVIVTGLDQLIISSNEAFEAITGYQSAEVVGRNCRFLQGPKTDPKTAAAIRAAVGARTVFDGEILNYRKDGSPFWNNLTIAPVKDAQGEITHFIGITRDVTSRKLAEAALRESEARYRRVMLGTNEGLWEWNLATGATYCSPRWHELVGLDATEEVRDLAAFTRLVHPDDLGRVMAAADEAVRDHKTFKVEMRLRRKDGSYVWLLSRAFVDYSPDGKPMTMTGSIADLTATREIERQLRQSQKLEAVGTLAAGVAHDFNNILSGIYGFTALARGAAAGNAEMEGYLDEITQAGRRGAELVRRILAFSRVRGDATTATSIAASTIVGESLSLLRATCPTTIRFVSEITPDLWIALTDESQLHQIVMNLATNAIQAMHDRIGQLTIRLERCVFDPGAAPTGLGLAPGPYVRLTVSDTGAGMTPEVQERVFEPFFTTKAPNEGTGLGLSVVHGIVREHGGAIRLTSQAGTGTTFEVYLCARQGTAADPGTEKPAAALPGRGERILFVDDEAPILKAGRLALARLGYETRCEANGESALAGFNADPDCFDLVITDQTMPLLTGLELATRIHAVRPGLPIVLASGYQAAISPQKLAAAGIRDVLAKPYTISELAACVRRQLESEKPA